MPRRASERSSLDELREHAALMEILTQVSQAALESGSLDERLKRIAQFLRDAQSTGARLALVDIPLLFESSHDYGLDRVAVTAADPEIYRRRALARPGMTVEKLEAILARQMPQDEKIERADYVIRTDTSLAETRDAVKAIVDDLTANPKPLQ